MARGSCVSQRRYSRWHYRVLPRACGKEGERSLAVWEFQQERDISKTCREKSRQPGCEELSPFLTVAWSAPQLLPKVRKVWPRLHCANVWLRGVLSRAAVLPLCVLITLTMERRVVLHTCPKNYLETKSQLKGHYRSHDDGKMYSTSTWSWRWLQPGRYRALRPATVLACIAITVNNNDEVFASPLPRR